LPINSLTNLSENEKSIILLWTSLVLLPEQSSDSATFQLPQNNTSLFFHHCNDLFENYLEHQSLCQFARKTCATVRYHGPPFCIEGYNLFQ